MPKPHGGKLINRVLKGKDRKKAAKTATNLEKVEISRTLATDTENDPIHQNIRKIVQKVQDLGYLDQ